MAFGYFQLQLVGGTGTKMNVHANMSTVQRLQLCTMAALLIFLSALLPSVRANFVTVTGSVFCDVDNSKYVNFPPDTPIRTAKVKIVCIIGPNATMYDTRD